MNSTQTYNPIESYDDCVKLIERQIKIEGDCRDYDNNNRLIISDLSEDFYQNINKFKKSLENNNESSASNDKIQTINKLLDELSGFRFTKCKIIISQQNTRENTVSEIFPSKLDCDFYMKINRYKATATENQVKTINSMLIPLLSKRIVKLFHFVNQQDTRKIHDLLADEEYFFWESITYAQKELKRKVVKDEF